jgi:hypothetical protein
MNTSKPNNHLHLFENYKPKPNKDWRLHSSDDQDKLVSQSNNGFFLLNPMAVFIWTFCDGKTEVRVIREALQEVFSENKEDITKDLFNLLRLWEENELIKFEIPLKKRQHHKLCIGMATYDDFDGVYFSVQAIRCYHPEVAEKIGILVVDNHPYGAIAQELKKLEAFIPNYYYIPYTETTGTAVRDVIFREADADYILCIDSHVLIMPGAIHKLIKFLDDNPDCYDLLQGPLLRDDMKSISTHMNPEWQGTIYGTWGTDAQGENIDSEPFEIPMQGLGLFACRKEAWLGFNPRFRGFGGEEGYIHEKFRQQGKRTLCLPFLRWLHRFQRPLKTPYELKWEDSIHNYWVGFDELGLDCSSIEKHFIEQIGQEQTEQIVSQVKKELESPFYFFDAIYCINLDSQTERWEKMQAGFQNLGILQRIRRFSAIETNPEVGYTLSHRHIVERAKRQGLKNVLVIEDEAIFPNDFELHLQHHLNLLKQQDWRFFYLNEIHQLKTGFQVIAYHQSIFAELLENLPSDKESMEVWLNTHGSLKQWLARNYPMTST